MKSLIAIIATLVLAQVAQAQNQPATKIVLKNDVTVGSKIYVRYEDIQNVFPNASPDDEGYCAIQDTGDIFANFQNFRILKAGSELMITGTEEGTHLNSRGAVVTGDRYLVVSTIRGKVKIACSIDTSASERNPYAVGPYEQAFLKSLGMELSQ